MTKPTLLEVIGDYHKTPGYKVLSRKSQLIYDQALLCLTPIVENPIEDIRRADIARLRDEMRDTPAKANNFLRVSKMLFNFAFQQGLIDHNPVSGMKTFQTGHHEAWSEAEIEYYLDWLGLSKTRPNVYGLHRAVILALFTGQRISDVLKMKWDDVDLKNNNISVYQQKTKTTVFVPLHRDLAVWLSSWWNNSIFDPELEPRIVTGMRNYGALAVKWDAFRKDHPLLADKTLHGLRKTFARRLAESGCSEREIMSLTGHKTTNMVSLYVAQADQKKMASNAMRKYADFTDR